MSTDIYYFSGTGNSLAVARDLAEKVGGRLLSIPSLMDDERVTVSADVAGLVFPVYHKGIPLILKRFVNKLDNLAGGYVFAVYTYGGTPGFGAVHLARLIRARGGQLAAGFGLHMPYNYLTPSLTLRNFLGSFKLSESPPEQQQALLSRVETRLESIAASVGDRRSGYFEVSSDPLTRLADRLNLYETLGKPTWLKVAGIHEGTDLPFLESRQLMDCGFHVDAGCNGCGVCAKVCPVGNVRMDGGKPVWQHRCEQCFACLHWCPKEALQFGSATAGKRRYHHPGVTLADMLRQRRRVNEAMAVA